MKGVPSQSIGASTSTVSNVASSVAACRRARRAAPRESAGRHSDRVFASNPLFPSPARHCRHRAHRRRAAVAWQTARSRRQSDAAPVRGQPSGRIGRKVPLVLGDRAHEIDGHAVEQRGCSARSHRPTSRDSSSPTFGTLGFGRAVPDDPQPLASLKEATSPATSFGTGDRLDTIFRTRSRHSNSLAQNAGSTLRTEFRRSPG